MIKFIDSLGFHRAIEFSLSRDGNYVNLTTWADKTINGSTIQLPIKTFKDLRIEICELKTEE